MDEADIGLDLRLLQARRRMELLREELSALPHWGLARGLADHAAETDRRIARLAAEKERKLAVVIVGPCGAGKSTLLNALADRDDLAPAGPTRPTTRTLTVFCADPGDGDYFKEKAGAANVAVKTAPQAAELRHLVLVDTPDTNSTEAGNHRDLVAAAIDAADVLLCVFPATNALARDQLVFLKPWVERFNPDGVYAVVTKSEQIPAAALDRDVMEPFLSLAGEVWGLEPAHAFAVSARNHLDHPAWNGAETPAQGHRDDFPDLRRAIREQLNRAGVSADFRAARATAWADAAERLAFRAASEGVPAARQAADGIRRLAQDLWTDAVRRMDAGLPIRGIEYRIVRRLWGPLSWCFWLWTLALHFVDLVAATAGALNRFARIGRRAGRKGPGEAADLSETPDADAVAAALPGDVAAAALSRWPDIERGLRLAGFDAKARENPLLPPRGEEYAKRLQRRLRGARDEWGRRLADGLFGGFGVGLLNLLFLAPLLALAYAGARQLLVSRQWPGAGFGGDGMWFVGVWWLLVLTGMHGWICWKERRGGGDRRLAEMLRETAPTVLVPEVLDELDRLVGLGTRDGGHDASGTGNGE